MPNLTPLPAPRQRYPVLALTYTVLKPEQLGHATHLLLLLHGVGTNETSLVAVGQQLANPALVLAVRSPLELGPRAYGFFRVSFATGRSVHDAAEAHRRRELLVQFIHEVRVAYGFAAAQVYLLDFNKGATMAYAASLTPPAGLGGVLAFSGRLLDDVTAQLAPAEQLHGLRF